MRHTIHKCFWAWQAEKEEAWINEMEAKGMHLIAVGYCTYIFEEGAAGTYIYRLELLENSKNHPESIQYLQFLEETGIEIVGNYLRWVYYRRAAALGAFDIYSDYSSRIRYCKRQMAFMLPLIMVNFSAALLNFSIFFAWYSSLNLVCAGISLALTLALLAGTRGIYKQLKALRKQRVITE
ncbi:MAG: DUF2812 domain-containing protein [Oscillospiraceae bacterium]|nr:DUF2812 domain-containing protein [Oscillospiraceae bacterium]